MRTCKLFLTELPRHRENRELDVHFSRQGKHKEFAQTINNMFLHKELPPTLGKILNLKK